MGDRFCIPKTIFFDAVGTLFDVNHGVGVQYSRIALKYGVSCDAAFLEERFGDAFKKSPPLAFPGTPVSLLAEAEKQWWRRLVCDVFHGISFPNFDPFFEELYSFFGGGEQSGDEPAWVCFPETAEVLEHLFHGHPLGMISNFDSRLYAVLESLGIARFFQMITVSSPEGVEKPSVEIFKRALARANCRPEDTLYIGDNPQTDGIGAMEAGIPFLLINRSLGANDTSRLLMIKNLREIYRYL